MLKVKSNKIWHGHLHPLNHSCIILMYNMLNTALEKQTQVKTCFVQWVVWSEWVSWCFESCQPQRIISGLKTNFSLSPSYSFHKSLYHKSVFSQTTAPILSTISERKTTKTNTYLGAYLYSASTQHGNLNQLCVTTSRMTYSAGLHRNRC